MRHRFWKLARRVDAALSAAAIDNAATAVALDRARARAWAEAWAEIDAAPARATGQPQPA